MSSECPICPICYEDFKEKDVSIAKCGHKFHTSCLIETIRRQPHDICPYCRSNISISVPKNGKKLADFLVPGTYTAEEIANTIVRNDIPLENVSRNVRTAIEEHAEFERERKEREEEFNQRERRRIDKMKSYDPNKYKLFTPNKLQK